MSYGLQAFYTATVGLAGAGPSKLADATIFKLCAAKLLAGAATSSLILYDGNGGPVIAILGAAVAGNTDDFYPDGAVIVASGQIYYDLVGAGSKAVLYTRCD